MKGIACTADRLCFSVRGADRKPQPILQDVSLAIEAGCVTALRGPSGSGKTTLLYLLSGLLVPSVGAIRWGADDLASFGEVRRDRWRRENAGFVFQDFHLIDELGPVDNVIATTWFTRFSAGSHRRAAEELLDRLGVPFGRGRTAFLSRGEQQRVAVARALLPDPAVIFADEPTASLDAQAGQEVATILRTLAEEERRTVVVASHDPAVLATADMVVSIERGCVTGIEERRRAAA